MDKKSAPPAGGTKKGGVPPASLKKFGRNMARVKHQKGK